jgi:hypothetical protein
VDPWKDVEVLSGFHDGIGAKCVAGGGRDNNKKLSRIYQYMEKRINFVKKYNS